MRWYPIREHPDYGRRHHPQVGDLIAYKYRPWVVAEIRTIDDGRTAIALRKPGTPDVAASIELHLAAPKLPDSRLHVLPERYAVCSCCGELAPCSSEIEDETVKAIQARDARYEVAGVCPACQEVVTPRQKSWTCSVNLHSPLGPPVTFHTRRGCHQEAVAYEASVAKAEGRQPRLSCSGFLQAHLYQPETCSNPDCPGGHVSHGSYDRSCELGSVCPRCSLIASVSVTPSVGDDDA